MHGTQGRRWATGAMLLFGLAAGGCSHITTKLPGVLDTRSDASAADARRVDVKDSGMARSGVDAILGGAGVTSGATVQIEDRKWWILRLVPLSNASATEEFEAALGRGALRRVTIGEQEGPIDIVMSLVASMGPWSVIGAWLTPSFTLSGSAEPIAVVDASPAVAAPITAPAIAAPLPVATPAPISTPVVVDPAGGAR